MIVLIQELRLEEMNTMVQSEIDLEHFFRGPKLDLGSDTNFCTSN